MLACLRRGRSAISGSLGVHRSLAASPSHPLSGSALLAWLATKPPDERDRAVEDYFDMGGAMSSAAPGEDLVGYHPSSVAAIVRALIEAPVLADDVFVDLGSGLGKVVLLARLLTGARVVGIEVQAELVARAAQTATRLGIELELVHADMRVASLDDGTVFFLYAPCFGVALEELVARLRVVAEVRDIIVCALGIELDRYAPWLCRRPSDSFWLSIYDSRVPGAAPLPPRRKHQLGSEAERVALGLA